MHTVCRDCSTNCSRNSSSCGSRWSLSRERSREFPVPSPSPYFLLTRVGQRWHAVSTSIPGRSEVAQLCEEGRGPFSARARRAQSEQRMETVYEARTISTSLDCKPTQNFSPQDAQNL